MAKYVGQVRYYKENNTTDNYPTNMSKARLMSGAAFSEVYPIVQLGVQTLPGTKLYINSHQNPIIVGATGIYELNVDGLSTITNLQFDPASLDLINENENAYLIVDYLYEMREGG